MFRLSALAVAAAALTLAACERPADKAEAPTQPAAAAIQASADVYPITIGSIQAAALRDGGMDLPLDGDMLPWTDRAAVRDALATAGQAGETLHLSIQPLLVRDGDRVVLIDSGAGGQMGTPSTLVASLRAAGVTPEQVTDVLISHAHGDHVGGLASAGALTFPNAVIRFSAPEWAFAQAGAAEAGAEGLVAAITPKVQTFEPGAQITSSIKAVPLAGHTPGHTGYEITSDGQSLLYIGDAMHSSAVSVARPDLVNGWDEDAAAGVATRQSLLTRGGRLYAVHFPFPGVGTIERRGEGHAWVPES